MLISIQQIHVSFKLSCHIHKGQIKVPQNKFWYTKYIGYKNI